MYPDFTATEFASTNVQWCNPADFDISDDSPDAKYFTGWFYRGKNSFGGDQWRGPYQTSSDAAIAAKKCGYDT